MFYLQWVSSAGHNCKNIAPRERYNNTLAFQKLISNADKFEFIVKVHMVYK